MRNPVVVSVIDKRLNICYISYMRLYSVSHGEWLRDEAKWRRFLHKIKENYDWQHPIEYVWFIKTDKSSDEIYKDLYEQGTFSGLIIAEVHPDSLRGWAATRFWRWLSEDDTRRNEDASKDTSDEQA